MSADFVRIAHEDDAGAIVDAALAAWPALGDDTTREDLVAAWQELLHLPGSAQALVATSDDAVVGWLLLTPALDPDVTEFDAWEVADVVVHPHCRRRGHGSRMMHAATAHAPATAQMLTTWCPVADELRRAFFTAHGFGPDGAWRDLASQSGETMREVRLVAALNNADRAPS